jgi:hypothetical protein
VGIVWGGANAKITLDNGAVLGPGQVASLNAVQGTGCGGAPGPGGAGGASPGTGGNAGAGGMAGILGLGNDNVAALQIP